MTTVNLEVKGLKELEDALDALPFKVARRGYRRSLKAGIAPIADEARANLAAVIMGGKKSVSYRQSSGELFNSIRVRARSARNSDDPAAQEVVLTAGNFQAYYAAWLEFGTRMHQVQAPPGKTLPIGQGVYRKMVETGISPKPYMRPAFDGKAQNAIELFAADMRTWLGGTGALDDSQ